MGVSNNIIVPFVGVEFDPTGAGAGPSALPFQACIFGHQSTAEGIETLNEPVLVLNLDDAASKFGIGSLLHQQARRWFSRNTFTPVYMVPVEQPAATAAEFDYTITGTATSTGTVPIMVDGERFSVGVAIGDTAEIVAIKLAAEVAANKDRHTFTTSVTTNVVTLTANYHGVIGSSHDVRDVYFDTDSIPAGLAVAITVTVGTGDVDITDAIAGIVNKWFQVLTMPFNDATNMGLMEVELERRFGPTVQQDGLCYVGYADTAANTITFADNSARNSQSMVLVDAYKYTQHNAFVATLVSAEVAKSASNDPGEPLHRIKISNLLPPVDSERYEMSTLNTLSTSGVMTLDPAGNGGPQTFGTVTMYRKSASGSLDTAYQFQNTMFILQYMRYDFVTQINNKYDRARLLDGTDRVRSGLKVITADLGKAEAVAIALGWEENGLLENIEQYKADIICRRSTLNKNRLEWILPPDLVNQFIVGSADMGFIL